MLPIEEAVFEIINRDLLVMEFGITDLEMAPKRRAMLRFDRFGAANQGVQIGMTGNESRDLVNLPRYKKDSPFYEQMETPLFLQARGQDLAADEPQASGNGDNQNEAIQQTNDEIDKDKPEPAGGRKKSTKGKARSGSWY